MPRISEFFGIVIGMFYRDHAPPHFHAAYGQHEATVGIDPIGSFTVSCRAGRNRWCLNGRLCANPNSGKTGSWQGSISRSNVSRRWSDDVEGR